MVCRGFRRRVLASLPDLPGMSTDFPPQGPMMVTVEPRVADAQRRGMLDPTWGVVLGMVIFFNTMA